MTIEKFEKKYIYVEQKKEKGVYITDKNSLINDTKVIRNLSQISYRILNYILYTHLFFARITTNQKEFDTYKPEGMTWVETLNECWNILKNELLKENINYIEHFMNYIFIDLFPVLNEANTIEDFENLIKIENELESAIQEMIKKYKNGGDKYGFNEKQKDENKTSIINLLL